MAENTSTFTGAAADGTALTAVYLTQPAANVAIGLVFAGSDLPHIVHWGRPLAKPDTLLAAYDALKPQRVSGALDDTAWPSILPTQAESWIGEQRVVLRRAGVELFPKFTVTNISKEKEGGRPLFLLMRVRRARRPRCRVRRKLHRCGRPCPCHRSGPRARRHSHRAR